MQHLLQVLLGLIIILLVNAKRLDLNKGIPHKSELIFPKPAEVAEMERWWCAQHPSSFACKRAVAHETVAEHQLKAKMEAIRAEVHAAPGGKEKDRQDIRDMHEGWCELKPEHMNCLAWRKNKAPHHEL